METILAIPNMLNTSWLVFTSSPRLMAYILNSCQSLILSVHCVQCEAESHSQTPTFDGVLSSGSCLTHVSGDLCLDSTDCSDRIGFTLSRSPSFSVPWIFTALRNSVLSGEHNQDLWEYLTFAVKRFTQLQSLPPLAINTKTLNTIPLFFPNQLTI